MNWLEMPALGLLASLAVLAWLVFMQRGAKRVAVGTLFIWRRVAARPDAKKRRAQLEVVLWLAAGALLLAALASARPALAPDAGSRGPGGRRACCPGGPRHWLLCSVSAASAA